jgi:REP element-mobilizing transposase RayT
VAFSGLGYDSVVRNDYVKAHLCQVVQVLNRTISEILFGNRYMSNHVHTLFKVDAVPMSQIVETWKKHTANKINRLLKRRGAFWAAGYFDTFMRDAEHEQRTVRYIENNPTKAKLLLDPKEWPWSSARFRDGYARLRL